MGGLFTALALREGGHDVTVFERSEPGGMESQGAGIIAHPEMLDWLDRREIVDRSNIATSTDRIQYLDADDEVIHERADTIYTSSWDTVYRNLRDRLGDDQYLMGHRVAGMWTGDDGQSVTVEFDDRPSRTGDLAVVAEGYRSRTRDAFLPDCTLAYAGYIAWRGTVPESELPADLFEQFSENYTFYHSPNSQILSYPVPGPNDELTPGERRINWVWYYNVPEPELESYLRTEKGTSRYSVPPGAMHPEVRETLQSIAAETLPDCFERLVGLTADPFIQSVQDLLVSRMVFDRTCIIGDAAAFIRPHMAAGTAKAAADGFELAEELSRYPDDVSMALAEWEESQLSRAAWMVAKAKQRGDIYTGRR